MIHQLKPVCGGLKMGANVKTETKKRLEWVIFSILGVITVLSLGLFSYQVSYAQKIYPGVSAAGIDLSGKTKEQARALIEKKYQTILDEELSLKTDTGLVNVKLKDTGLSLDNVIIVNDAFKVGRSDKFFKTIAESTKTLWTKREITVRPKIDETKYNNFLTIAVAQLNSEPVDASLKVENGEVKTIQEKNGKTVDTTSLINMIMDLPTEQSNKTIILTATIKSPAVKAADFETASVYANNILGKKFTFTFEDQTYSPSKTEIGPWIAFSNTNGKFTGSLNDNNIQAYLNKIAKNFEIVKVDKKINAKDNAVLSEGREGRYLDKNAAIAQIKSQMSETGISTIPLVTYAMAPSEVKIFPDEGLVPGRFEGKYIDIDLTLQKLCRVDGPTVVDCYIISSGKPSMPTPAGTFQIFEKNPRRWSTQYSMWLPWWQQFKSGGWGIHELPETATWKEVPDHLGTPISHGCVRLGVGPAETVYNWTEIGTTVYVHK